MKGQTYKTDILLCHQVMCLFRTEPFACELLTKIHTSLSCHYKWTNTIVTLVMTAQTMSFCQELACKGFSTEKAHHPVT